MHISVRQKEILEAAAGLLTKFGVSGVTIKNLAKEMNFTEGAIYRHFESKEQIILAMLEFVLQNVDRQYLAESVELLSPAEQLQKLFRNQFSFFRKNPHLAVAIFSDGFLDESQLINAQLEKIFTARRKLILPLIKEGQRQKQFRSDLSAAEIVHIIMGAVKLQIYKWRMSQFETDIAKEGAKLIKGVLKLIQA